MIPTSNFESDPKFLENLIDIVQLSETHWMEIEESKRIIQRSISLIYTLTMSVNICEIIKQNLLKHDRINFFSNLSSNSTNKHIKFTSTLIHWSLNKQNQSNQTYSPTMIRTFVYYLNKCGDNSSQQYYGVSIDSMIKTLTSKQTHKLLS